MISVCIDYSYHAAGIKQQVPEHNAQRMATIRKDRQQYKGELVRVSQAPNHSRVLCNCMSINDELENVFLP